MLCMRSGVAVLSLVAVLGISAVAGARAPHKSKPADVRPSADCTDAKPKTLKVKSKQAAEPCRDTSRGRNMVVLSIDGDSIMPDAAVTILRIKSKAKKA